MILLDTHALVWWANETALLSSRSRLAIDGEIKNGAVASSAMSAWEICLLVKAGRVTLATDIETWLRDLEILPYFRFIPVDVHIAKSAVFLPNWSHKDPADRIIVATALRLGVPIVTKDEKIRRSKLVRTIW
ncbi:MAG: type II toxin-antitoxin system VapC family toxin [Candidatus Gottesmanbacteria bacterium]|nr:type II toxin-antitoxin system VapC family toxin [Candidatus Gottesmanbacteria bacterium]